MRAATLLSCLVLGTALSAAPGWSAARRREKRDRAPEAPAAVPLELPPDARQLLLVTTASRQGIHGHHTFAVQLRNKGNAAIHGFIAPLAIGRTLAQ